MAIGLKAPLDLQAIPGVRLGTAASESRYSGRDDLLLIALAPGTQAAAVFTQNAFKAAPVLLAEAHARQGAPHYLLVNAGNANAGTGEQGIRDAQACCQAVADIAACNPEEVWPFSTGVIAEPLPVAPLCKAVPSAWAALSVNGWHKAAQAILTTDTVAKGISVSKEVAGSALTITGIVKGSGMIRPDMATLLCYIATDAKVAPALLQRCLSEAVDRSFHCITVDGDTSTNDSCILLASGQGQVQVEQADSKAYEALQAGVTQVCEWLAEAVVRDAEGINRLIRIEVESAHDLAEARRVAFTVAHSPLVKTAFFAGDPNWGRILAAVGRAGIEALDLTTIDIYLGDVCVLRGGQRAADYREQDGQEVMSKEQVRVRIALGRGAAQTKIWTSDLSYEYVKINAEYRT